MSTLLAPTAVTPPAAGDVLRPGRRTRRPAPMLVASRSAAELAVAAQGGDVDAAGELYRRVRGRARKAACGFCLDVDADDAVAEGLSRALGRIGQLRDPAAVETWMVRSVVRSAIDLSRQRQRQRPTDAVNRLVEGAAESAAERAMLALERDSMAQAVRQLEPELRNLLYLRYAACLPVERIATALGRPAGTVRRQCLEARRMAGQQFLWCHLRPAIGACAQVTELLCQEPYRRTAVRRRKRATEHLRRCRACRDRQIELAAVLAEMGGRRAQRRTS